MSKTRLNKELQYMTKDQLIELILDHYSLRKDAKTFLDYYIDPNPHKLFDAFQIKVDRELSRAKWGHSKARISNLKHLLSDLESFQPGDDIIIEATFFLLKSLIKKEKKLIFSSTLINGTLFFLDKFLDSSARNYTLDKGLKLLSEFIDDSDNVRRSFLSDIKTHIAAWLETSAHNLRL